MLYHEQYYRNLCEQLQERIALLEKKIAEKKESKEKLANKDYDGDGVIETGKKEYFGSKDKAIKKNIAKKKGIVDKKKKKKLEEGRIIGGGNFLYGGFPRVLKEENKGPDHGSIAFMIGHNSYDGTDFTPEQYPLLPKDVHTQLTGLVGDELEQFAEGEITSQTPNLHRHHQDIKKALTLLQGTGFGKHPAAITLDHIRTKFQDAVAEGEYQEDRRRGMHNPR